MFHKRLKFQVLIAVLVVLMSGILILYYTSSSKIKKTIDDYQQLYYTEKIDTILHTLESKYQKLQKTQMVESYEDNFKQLAISELKKVYSDKTMRIYPFVINNENVFIVHPSLNGKNKNLYQNNANFKYIVKEKDGNLLSFHLNEKKWTIFKHFKKWNWIVGYSIPEKVKYEGLVSFQKEFFYLTLGILIAISIFVAILVRYILAPIERLIIASKRISSGDLQSDIKINGSYELTQLSQSFSQMRDKIKQNIDELEETNRNLEKLVQNRTQKIQESNAELKNTITNLKLTQTQLIESEKIASLGKLVAGVAHEINTPLGIGVTGITHLIDTNKTITKNYKADNLSQDEFENFLNISRDISEAIYLNMSKAADLIKSFKKIAVDRTSEEKRQFELKEYVQEILKSLRNLTKNTHHKFSIEGEDNLLIDSYPGLISQVITNLIMNSLIHGLKDSKDGEVKINIKSENNSAWIEFSDNGIGISKKNLPKVFDPFFTTNRNHGGSGLGMSIIHNIITSQLNGHINLSSEEGAGVQIVIDFPL